jgi:hypothetical protein
LRWDPSRGSAANSAQSVRQASAAAPRLLLVRRRPGSLIAQCSSKDLDAFFGLLSTYSSTHLSSQNRTQWGRIARGSLCGLSRKSSTLGLIPASNVPVPETATLVYFWLAKIALIAAVR